MRGAHYLRRAWERMREIGRRILLLHGSPHGIAFGFALGLTFSVIPTFGVGMFAALALAPVLRMNPVAVYFGTWMVNPFTAPAFFYPADYAVGVLILGQAQGRSVREVFGSMASQLADFGQLSWGDRWGFLGRFLVQFYVGGLILGLAFGLISYPVIYIAVTLYRKKNKAAA